MRRIGALLRRADPARGDLQPDARGESDLRLLVGESVPLASQDARPARPTARAALVTVVVVAVVVGLSAAVLVGTRGARTGVAASATALATIDGCDPVAVLPLQCGTYRSVYGATSVSRGAGGPAADPLTLSFLPLQGGLLLRARNAQCLDAAVPVRAVAQGDGDYRLERIGAAHIDQHGCIAPTDGSWALAWLRGPLQVDASALGGLAFNSATALVTFEYEGTAPPGSAQLPRNDSGCVAAHVEPFVCGEYRSVGGSGSLAFLATDHFRLSFKHINGELTGTMEGACNAISVVFETAGDTAVALPGGSTAEACSGKPGAEDASVMGFFHGTLTVRVENGAVVFSNGADSARFALPGA